jgi:hypothetical protein
MENNKTNTSENMQKFVKGLELVTKKLIESKRRNNGVLVVMDGDVIKKIKAIDIID